MSYSRRNTESQHSSSWTEDSGYQTGRTGFGYKAQEPSQKTASTLSEKVADVDAKMADFMAEIAEMETQEEIPLPDKSSENEPKRTSHKGFVSAGHIIQSKKLEESHSNNSGEPMTIIEPTTVWQHLLDANTQHYYYWNMNSNQVTWTIPDEYSEYLVKHKLFREEVVNSEKKGIKVRIIKDDEVQESITPDINQTEPENAEVEETQNIIGPQLPKKKPAVSETQMQVVDKSQNSPKQQSAYTQSSATQNNSENQTSNKGLLNLIAYSADQSDNEEDAYEEVDEDKDMPHMKSNGAVKSLVAYDVSYTMTQEDLGDMVEVDEDQTETTELNNIEKIEPETLDAPLVFTKPQDPPTEPDPVIQEEATPIVGPSYLSSSGISEYYNRVSDKCECLDIYAEKGDVSQLQLLLIQLKTRLDDWNAGALKREYLMSKIREANSLIEDCESASAPVGWTCVWSKTEKIYYYVHDITEEISYTYPEDFIDSLQQVISLKDEPEPRNTLTSTLSTLKTSITTVPNKATNKMKALFAEQILLKLGPSETETSKQLSNEENLTEGTDVNKDTEKQENQEVSKEFQIRDSSSDKNRSRENSRDKSSKRKRKTKKKKKHHRNSDSESYVNVHRKSEREMTPDRVHSSPATRDTVRKRSLSRSRDRNRNRSPSADRSHKRSRSKDQRKEDRSDCEKEKYKKRKRSGSPEKKQSKKQKHKKHSKSKHHKKDKLADKKTLEEGERCSDSDVIELGSSPEMTINRELVKVSSKIAQRNHHRTRDSRRTPSATRDSAEKNGGESPVVHKNVASHKLLSLAEEALAKRREKMKQEGGMAEMEINKPVFPIITPKRQLVQGIPTSESDDSSDQQDAINLLDELMNKKANERRAQLAEKDVAKETEPILERTSEAPEVEEPSIDDILEGLSREFEEEKRKKSTLVDDNMEIASSPESVQVATVVEQPAVLYNQTDSTISGFPPPVGLTKPELPSQSIAIVSSKPVRVAKPPKPADVAVQMQPTTALAGPTGSGDTEDSPQITCKVKWKKKDKKTKGKMPDLVNKWKKVQTEMEKEFEKEKQFYKKLLD